MLLENAYGSRLRFNVLSGKPEFFDRVQKTWQEWQDVNDAQIRAWFQNNYGLYHEKMLRDALQIHFESHKVNPLTDLLESVIFAGGIHRAYRPGCKFDDMVVLVGKQGGGKSTLVRWLNMDDSFFREIKTITGKEGIEALRGVWIAEVAELMALTRVREAETVKAYITAQEDSYRAPYTRYVQTIPRRCTFIGTTNNSLFLSDRTGNRRFYPVKCNMDGYDLLAHEKEVRAYIAQCWAEALDLYKRSASALRG